jgi:glucose/arabinose dehydrogenase
MTYTIKKSSKGNPLLIRRGYSYKLITGKAHIAVIPKGEKWVAQDEKKNVICTKSSDKYTVVKCASEYASKNNKPLYVMGYNGHLYYGGTISNSQNDDNLIKSINIYNNKEK